eukprot:5705281-Amphidinium_carterae.1
MSVASSPAEAFMLLCVRLGWELPEPHLLKLHDGSALDLKVHSPKFVESRVRAATRIWSDLVANQRFGKAEALWWEPLKLAHRQCQLRLGALAAHGLSLAPAGGLWCQASLFQRGLSSSASPACLL